MTMQIDNRLHVGVLLGDNSILNPHILLTYFTHKSNDHLKTHSLYTVMEFCFRFNSVEEFQLSVAMTVEILTDFMALISITVIIKTVLSCRLDENLEETNELSFMS